MIRRWSPTEIGPPVGQYSHLAATSADNELIFVSGQVGSLPDGTLAGSDAATQTRQILDNLGVLLAGAGGGPEHLLKVFTMVAGTEHVAGCRSARSDVFARWYPDGDWPAQSLIVVAGLASPEIVVEIEAVAAIPRS
ncbi:RidA family protein [Streptomyces olivaceoviridis]|uniref:RidA family protein n=1 Tax=Streptomyces TaxID=1883 RepID=UPI003455522A